MSSEFIKEKALPNILIHFWKFALSKDEEHAFLNTIRKTINKIYGQNRFVVYMIRNEELQINPKFFSSQLLLIITKTLEMKIPEFFNQEKFSNLKKITLDYNKLSLDNFDFDYFHKTMKNIIPANHIGIDTILEESNDLFLFDDQNIHRKWSTLGCSLKLIPYCDDNLKSVPDSAFLIDWINDQKVVKINFDVNSYFNNLRTQYIGRVLLFTNITSTTMSIANKVKEINGIVTVANYQTSGEGRNQNQWISPFGCAMFTINLRFSLLNFTMCKIPLIQHIASLSIIQALPSKKLNIKIKWPNDILFTGSMSKLAGILVRSYSYESYIIVQAGIGVNVSNNYPSICLDELIKHYNVKQEKLNNEKLELIGREELIAKILNSFEHLLGKFNRNDLEEIKELYCENWIHSDSIIDVYLEPANDSSKREAKVIGIDDNGYLLAKDLSNGQILSLQPDGNRFDLMNHLTALKFNS